MRERDLQGSETVLAILRSSGRERNIAVWSACADITKTLDLYLPVDFETPESLRSKGSWLNSLRNARELKDLAELASADPAAFGAYRVAVWDNEGINARRLDVLVWVLRSLYRLRDLPEADTNMIDRLASKIADMLTDTWKVSDPPLHGIADRDWSTRKTRRYDLLPKMWRWV